MILPSDEGSPLICYRGLPFQQALVHLVPSTTLLSLPSERMRRGLEASDLPLKAPTICHQEFPWPGLTVTQQDTPYPTASGITPARSAYRDPIERLLPHQPSQLHRNPTERLLPHHPSLALPCPSQLCPARVSDTFSSPQTA